jgi:hypothetical protein
MVFTHKERKKEKGDTTQTKKKYKVCILENMKMVAKFE